MNLYELAHHPDAFRCSKDSEARSNFWWGKHDISTLEQFDYLRFNNSEKQDHSASAHTDENEFRMHLLFVWWSTQK